MLERADSTTRCRQDVRNVREIAGTDMLGVGSDDSDVLGLDAEGASVVEEVLDIAEHNCDLLAVEPRGRVALSLLLALHPVEHQRELTLARRLHTPRTRQRQLSTEHSRAPNQKHDWFHTSPRKTAAWDASWSSRATV
eukprot:1256516-Rhodomonas_salina.1